MGSYQVMPRSGGFVVSVTSKNLKDLFGVALSGMAHIMKDIAIEEADEADMERNISLSAPEPTLLLVDFLSKVLNDSYEHDILYTKVKFDKMDGTTLKARLYGLSVGAFDEELRGVIYNEVEIKKNADGQMEGTITFDV